MHETTTQITVSAVRDAILPAITPVTDETLVREWLRSKRSLHTRRAYHHGIKTFYCFLEAPQSPAPRRSIREVTLTDLQDYADHLHRLYPEAATQGRKLAAIKSLLTFAHKTGAIPFNVGAAQQLPQGKDKLAQRILSPIQVSNMIYEARSHALHHAMLLLLYGSGIRCEELCNLQWCDVQETSTSGQITVLGKHRKTRSIPLHPKVWQTLQDVRPEGVQSDKYVFPSRQTTLRDGKPSRRLTESQVWRNVSTIAKRAGIHGASTHWLRHAHARHGEGCPTSIDSGDARTF